MKLNTLPKVFQNKYFLYVSITPPKLMTDSAKTKNTPKKLGFVKVPLTRT